MQPRMTILDRPQLMKAAKQFATSAKLKITNNQLVYLDVDDQYIHTLYPLLNTPANKPNYFAKDSAGAHISVIYPEENIKINAADLDKTHQFVIKELVAAEIANKIYYAILVDSVSLVQLRQQYHLSKLLPFKGYAIGFHITIGVIINPSIT